MECGDLSPLSTGEFIRPRWTPCDVARRRNEFRRERRRRVDALHIGACRKQDRLRLL